MDIKEYTKIINTPDNEEIGWYSVICEIEKVGPLCEIAFDSCERYKKLKNGRIFLLRNGYTDNSEWVPFSVEEHPQPLVEFQRKISLKDYIKTLKLVSQNLEVIQEHGDIKTDTIGLIHGLREKKEMLNEMPNLQTVQTGLPYDIWIDKGATYKLGKHWMRIKVRKEKGGDATYTIPDHEWKRDEGMSGWEKKMVEKYIEYNEEDLIKLFSKQLTMDQFKSRMVIVNDRGEAVNPEAKDEWYLYKDAGYGYKIVINSLDGTFNYMNKEGEIMSPQNFDECNPFLNMKGRLLCQGRVNDEAFVYEIRNHKFVLIDKHKIN